MSQNAQRILGRIGAPITEDTPPPPRPDVPTLLAELAGTIRDLERQVSNEYRAKFYGECRGILKALFMAQLINDTEREQWAADIYRANLQAVDQCTAAGSLADADEIRRQVHQLKRLAELGITPRLQVPLLFV